MESYSKFLLVILLSLVFLAGCTQSQKDNLPPAQGGDNASAAQKSQEGMVHEIFRLQALSYKRNLTLGDLTNLSPMVDENEKMQEEFGELTWMLERGYQHHAVHTMQSLYGMATGTEVICPTDPLSHASPYLKFGELEKAKDAVREGAEQLPEWEVAAKRLKSQNPNLYPDLDKMLAAMKKEISDMDAKNYAAAQADAEYLENNGYW